MGYRCSFMDNEIYSAQDVNERIACMFTAGVSLADSENILADLNGMTRDIATSGVLPDSCKVEKTDSGYRITKGSAIMPDGSGIAFDSDGYEFTSESGVYNYVYLKRNEPYNRIDIVVSSQPPEEECVSLAVITENGVVHDRRKYAQSKLSSTQEGTLRKITKEFLHTDSFEGETYDMGTGNFTYLLLLDCVTKASEPRHLYAAKRDVVEMTDGEELEMPLINEGGTTCAILYVKKDGSLLEVRLHSYDNWMSYELTFGVI